jgi:hypothetical protein
MLLIVTNVTPATFAVARLLYCGGRAGTMLLEAAEAAEVPLAFVAVTVNV